ncbi:hypothetical protein TMatcc_003340 [Talaromyces marneffei ATCC 18224]|uniref:YMC020W-like alpha/beta hydrolase domain-containing protein n=1 Tax=Talaromyces marneffei (strain ATCC 18224 / CBS 334.59 / QM 7333) TaxID=441960 RepID=B6Q4U0_TALMQ|nr:uncharacterized protein EYB26_001598 [Talaromyces marneffei]EEA28329.1 conserved hypothetical protein [Talaromyces marneffei ATCC 18224]QGA13946.1 hypothetical protein EYB26_001598 [Talaromyces marneffei]
MGPRKQLKSTPPATDPSTPTSTSDLTQHNSSASPKRASNPAWTTKTWPHGRKAAAVTEVARESISAAGNITSELVSSTTSLPQIRTPNRPGSIQLIKKTSASNRSLPADATTTLINIDSNRSASDSAVNKGVLQSDIKGSEDIEASTPNQDSALIKEDTNTEAPVAPDNTQTNPTPEKEPQSNERPTSTWFGWLGLGRTTDKPSTEVGGMGESESTPAAADSESSKVAGNVTEADKAPGTEIPPNDQQKQNDTNAPAPPKRSWMQMWGTTNASQVKEPQEGASVKEPRIEQGEPMEQDTAATGDNQNIQPDKTQDADSQKRRSGPSKSSGWAFWSRDISNMEQKPGSESQQEPGELVVSGQPKVQSNSEDVVARVDNSTSPASTIKSLQKSKKKTTKSVDIKNAKSVEVVEDTTDATTTTTLASAAQTSEVSASTKLESVLTNQLLPSFKDTFALQESPSWLKTLGRMIYSPKDSRNRHVFALRDPPRPKKALAIGVHGYFPAQYLRTVLGQPTGTSLKFSTMAAKAIHQWADSHGYHCDVEKIALEGEGRIAERVDLLWKLLLKWIEEIRKAEFIMFACHSQGVPVTIMLVAKLIAFGCLDAARVGVCAMAGVNLGPFPDYKSRFIGGSAGELFDFAHPTTKVSRDYEDALKTALDFGVRISYVGSIDDQLVSLESSLFVPVSHPYIYRAVFVDGRVHAPSFLSHLVGFALKLRNLGIQDHGLIRELSAPLVGSLVGGEGHSRLHDEENIYYTAVQFALETSTITSPPPSLHIQRHNLTLTPNPYILPFALRGLLEEDYVRHELHEESLELLRQFDEWKPATKVLRDVKFRLEGIRSKL